MPNDYGKYARPERERRFLLDAVPVAAIPAHRILDRYIRGTRLRVRRMESLRDGSVAYKLAQKLRPVEDDASVVMITNTYLDEAEYELLCRLPADTLEKTRHRLLVGDRPAAVDVFADGLILLEVDFESDEAMSAFEPPAFVAREVTVDDAFSGGGLARR